MQTSLNFQPEITAEKKFKNKVKNFLLLLLLAELLFTSLKKGHFKGRYADFVEISTQKRVRKFLEK